MSRSAKLTAIGGLALLLLVITLSPRLGSWIHERLLALHGHAVAESPDEDASKRVRSDASVDPDAPLSAVPENATAEEPGWPDTPAGRVASAWVDAFLTGEEAMRTFLVGNLSEAAQAERSMPERLQSYRQAQQQFGALMLASVAESTPTRVTAVLLAEDATPHRFVFSVEEEPPYKLVSVGVQQHGHGHGAPRR